MSTWYLVRLRVRLAGSCAAAVFGLCLVVGATALLWWNEGDAVRAQASIAEARDALGPPSSRGLVHVRGYLTTDGAPLEDSEFGVRAESSMRMQRKVEVFLWREHAETHSKRVPDGRGGHATEKTTTYRYTAEWASSAIDSRRFHHEPDHRNPSWEEATAAAAARARRSFSARSWESPRVSLDGLRLGPSLRSRADRPTPLAPDSASVKAALLSDAGGVNGDVKGAGATLHGTHVYSSRRCAPPREPEVRSVRLSRGTTRQPPTPYPNLARTVNLTPSLASP